MLIVISYFSLACIYFLTTLGIATKIWHKHPLLNYILKFFYVLLLVHCVLRMLSFIACAIYLSGSAGLYRFLKSGKSFSHSELIEIESLMTNSTQSTYLPIETDDYMGINRAPKTLVCCLLMPELALMSAYVFLVWEMLNAQHEAHPNDIFKKISNKSDDQVVTLILTVFIGSYLVMYILYLVGVMPAVVILLSQITILLVAPVLVISLMLWL